MGRPRKQTVDYFPHFVSTDSRTKFILEQSWGNDGYAFWFKLLELLGRSEGHYYDCSATANEKYLVALMKLDKDTISEILRYWQTSETLTRNFGRNVRSFGVRASWIICRTYIQRGRYQHPKGHSRNRQRRKARSLRPRQRKSRRRTNRRNEAGRRGQGRSRKSPGRCRKSSKHYLIDFMRCTRKR